MLFRSYKVIKLKHECIVGELAIFNNGGSFEYMPIDMVGTCESEAPTALAMCHERSMTFMGITRHLVLLCHFVEIRSGHMFVNDEDLEKNEQHKSLPTTRVTCNTKSFLNILYIFSA